jgi:catechol 2,3-dioxygenase-like lactoylglutathione lyase family enzyme
MIERHMYVLAVPDLARSSAFYRDVLGFSVRDMAPGWLLYVKDSCQIMAGECPDAMPARDLGDHSYFGYLVVDSRRRLSSTRRCGGRRDREAAA